MDFKAGDKVKFLNTIGGGIVTKVISPTMVSVAIEEGFEVPTLMKELLKIEDTGTASRMFNQDFNVDINSIQNNNQTTNKQNIVEEDSFDRKSALRRAYNNVDQQAGIYLAYVPQDQRWLTTGSLDVYLINHTEYDVLYSLFLTSDDGKFNGIDYDVLQKETKTHLATISREELDLWSKGVVQALFHAEEKERVLVPLNVEFKVKAPRFYKEENYIPTSFLFEKSLLITIGHLSDNAAFAVPSLRRKDKEEVVELKVKKVRHTEPENILTDHMVNSSSAEVDLHIGQLIDDCHLLENDEMLRIQLDYFNRCLEGAFMNKIQKIIFIHGVGNGTLKNEIIKILKAYDNVHYFDASLAKYGVGATEVFINTTNV